MFKIGTVFFLLSALVFAKGIHFSETKYYDALEKTFTKKGNIIFDGKGKIRIEYEANQGVLTYTGDFLYIEKKGKTKKIDVRVKPEIKMFFTLFEAIYLNKNHVIEAFFERKVTEGITTLLPSKKSEKYILNVRYKREQDKVVFLEIYLTNKDWVKIETGD